MAIKLPQELVNDIWNAMWLENRRPGGLVLSKHFTDALKTGWASVSDLENTLCELDNRIDDALYRCGFEETLQAFGYVPQFIFPRPKVRTNEEDWSLYSKYVPVSDAASFLISIQALGFDVDPSPLIAELMPLIRKKEVITRSELHLVRFSRKQLKSIIMFQCDERRGNQGETQRGKLGTGQKAEAFIWGCGNVYHFSVSGRQRAERQPIVTPKSILLSMS